MISRRRFEFRSNRMARGYFKDNPRDTLLDIRRDAGAPELPHPVRKPWLSTRTSSLSPLSAHYRSRRACTWSRRGCETSRRMKARGDSRRLRVSRFTGGAPFFSLSQPGDEFATYVFCFDPLQSTRKPCVTSRLGPIISIRDIDCILSGKLNRGKRGAIWPWQDQENALVLLDFSFLHTRRHARY